MEKQTSSKQSELPAAEVPSLVQNGFALVSFVRATLDRDRKDEPYIAYDLSFMLAEDLKKFIPRQAKRAWEAMTSNGLSNCTIKDPPSLNITFAQVPDGDPKPLIENEATVLKMKLDTVKAKGSGKEKSGVRLSVRVRLNLTDQTLRFARICFGRNIWLAWTTAQGEMFN